MSLPIRHLPVVQNWDCHQCGTCCKEYLVAITDEEKQRIDQQNWQEDPELRGAQLFLRRGLPWRRFWQLNHRPDGSCVFLTDDGRCRIHARFGFDAKPLPCRMYPFVLIPGGDHWRVGIRYACPSAVSNLGRAVEKHDPLLADLAQGLKEREKVGISGGKFELPLPRLKAGQRIAWDDLLQINQALLRLAGDRRDRMELRLRKCLALAGLARQAQFDKLSGGRLREFLDILATSGETAVPRDLSAVPPPTGAGRVLFRMILALFARKDHGPQRGPGAGSRLALLRAAIAFTRGSGQVPRLHGWMPEMTFDQVDTAPTRSNEQTELLLERYYAVKIGSLQFFGPPFFGYPYWDGLEALALTYPLMHFLARMFTQMTPVEALGRAMSIVDDPFGFNKFLRGSRYRLTFRMLGWLGEIERLIAWYSR
jgi:lysine-N-methylase